MFSTEKQNWIIQYLSDNDYADILNADFVEKYIDKFNAPYKICFFGAHKCAELGRLLGYMYHAHIIDRYPSSLNMAEKGFPKWVYVYSLRSHP